MCSVRSQLHRKSKVSSKPYHGEPSSVNGADVRDFSGHFCVLVGGGAILGLDPICVENSFVSGEDSGAGSHPDVFWEKHRVGFSDNGQSFSDRAKVDETCAGADSGGAGSSPGFAAEGAH